VSPWPRRRLAGAAALLAAVVTVLIVVLASGSPGGPHRPTATSSSHSATSSASSNTTTSSSPAAPLPLPSATPLPAKAAPSPETFGANVNLLFDGRGPSAAVIAAQLHALRVAGATVARSDAFWEASEPAAPVGTAHSYDWGFDDQIATALATAGLRWLPVLDYSAPWAQSITGQDHSPPRSDAEFAAYAEAFAARYGAGGSFWKLHPQLTALPVDTFEIWNEPDNAEFWTPQPNPTAYAGLYLAARLAIDTVDASARVIVGGLTRLPSFLPAMLVALPSLRGHIDGVGIHPYGTPSVAFDRVRTARGALRLLGMAGVPLYATEFGWTTQRPGALDYVPAAIRPSYITRTLGEFAHRRCGLANALIYTWYSPEQDPGDSQQWYGLSGRSAEGTPATAAFADALRAAAHPGAAGTC
jgi:hypothetical protein